MPIPGESIVGGVTGLIQAGIGIAQKIKAAKLAKHNKRPDLEDDPYLDDAYNLAVSGASEGLSTSTKQQYLTNNDRNLSSSLNAMLTLGGGPNLVSELYDDSGNQLRVLAAADEAAKVRNRETYFTYAKAKASENRDEWMLNKYVPYRDTQEQIASLSKQGMDNIWKGINTTGSAVISAMDPYKTGKDATIPGGDKELSGGSMAIGDMSKYFTKLGGPKPKMNVPGVTGTYRDIPGVTSQGPGAFDPEQPWLGLDY